MPVYCTYCGSDSDLQREHVISATYLGTRSYDEDKQWIVPACRICNLLAGSKVFFSIPDKAEYILSRYRKRYKKILSIPYWDEEELKSMGYLLRASIEGGIMAKAIINQRVRYLEIVTTYAGDYRRPKWVQAEFEKWKRNQKRKIPKKKKSRWEKDFR